MEKEGASRGRSQSRSFGSLRTGSEEGKPSPSGVKGRAGKISVVAFEGTPGFLHGLTNSPGMGVGVVKQCSRANLVWITGFVGMNRAIAPEDLQMTGHYLDSHSAHHPSFSARP